MKLSQNIENTEKIEKKKIVITGGNGFLGRILSEAFLEKGYKVTSLVRRLNNKPLDARLKWVIWDGVSTGPWIKELEGAELIINLAGKSVDCRYTDRNKKAILKSRLDSTKIIGEALSELENPPQLWINAASATIYRHSLDKSMDEVTGELGAGFSVDVCKNWEAMALSYKTPRTRQVLLRTAMVMGAEGGVFPVLSKLTRRGLGGKQGSGKQFVSWIHEDDFVSSIIWISKDTKLEGVINCSAPNPVPNEDIMKALRNTHKKTIGLNANKWMLEIGAFILRTETELVLKSRKVVPARLLNAGFKFKYPLIYEAIEDLNFKRLKQAKKIKSSFMLSWILSIIMCAAGFGFLINGWIGYGVSIFCVLPVVLGLTTGILPDSKRATQGLFVGLLLFFIFLLITGYEGAVCLLMAVPILVPFIAVGYFISYLIKRNSKRTNVKMYMTLTPFLIFVAATFIENIMGDDTQIESVTTSVFIPHNPIDVYDEIIHVDMVNADQGWLHKIGLPVPIKCILTEEKIGGQRICEFEEGRIVETITDFERGKLLQMDVTQFELKGRSWLTFDEDIYNFEEKNGGTIISRTTTYYSKLKPRMYWQVAEAVTISAEQDLVFRNLKKDLTAKN